MDEVAALTGYCEATISLIERGKRELRPLDKVRFARSLRVPLRDLFEFSEPFREGNDISGSVAPHGC